MYETLFDRFEKNIFAGYEKYQTSSTTHLVCVNFIHELRDLQFIVDSERQIFEKLFIAISSQNFCEK